MSKKLIPALTFGLALGFATVAQAAAVPGGAPAPLPVPDNVLNAQHCHSNCELGSGGWHYHAGPRCKQRIACGVSPGGHYIWRCDRGRCGWWHPVLFRWH